MSNNLKKVYHASMKISAKGVFLGEKCKHYD
jgi:hypothetical protein